MNPLSVIKIGGAALTRADGPDGLDLDVARCLAAELHALAGHQFVLVHGTGTVGKPPALEFGYAQEGALPAARAALSCEIHRRIRALNQRFVQVLLEAGIPALGVDPALLIAADFRDLRGPGARSFLEDLVANGVLPVIYGDMVPQPNGEFRVLSSDVIACLLATELAAENLIFLSSVDGVHDLSEAHATPRLMSRFSSRDLARPGLFGPGDEADVSGGMRAKIRMALTASRRCRSCWVGSGRVAGLLALFFEHGMVTGTTISDEEP